MLEFEPVSLMIRIELVNL